MKRSLVITILGLSAVAATTATSFGQGGIDIGSYRGTFNETVWGPGQGPRAGQAVLAAEGVQLQLWYGEGAGLTDAQLTLNVPLNWNSGSESAGYGGYYGPIVAVLPGWSTGETWSFQVRALGVSPYGAIDPQASRSVIWTENANINDIGGNPPGTPGFSQNSIGFMVFVPEPSTFALAGLGALAALMNFRRRS
jgi:hypothetical protein